MPRLTDNECTHVISSSLGDAVVILAISFGFEAIKLGVEFCER